MLRIFVLSLIMLASAAVATAAPVSANPKLYRLIFGNSIGSVTFNDQLFIYSGGLASLDFSVLQSRFLKTKSIRDSAVIASSWTGALAVERRPGGEGMPRWGAKDDFTFQKVSASVFGVGNPSGSAEISFLRDGTWTCAGDCFEYVFWKPTGEYLTSSSAHTSGSYSISYVPLPASLALYLSILFATPVLRFARLRTSPS